MQIPVSPRRTRKAIRISPAANFAPAIMVAAVVIGALILAVLVWSGREADRIARQRDRQIVSLVIEQSVERIAHAQESSTIWDDAVIEARRRPLDLSWIDLNLGTWFDDYAGFDEVYLISPDDQPIYAMRGGRRTSPETFIAVEEVARPLIARLRRTTSINRTVGSLAMLSPGQADLAVLRGRPAIISAKPIRSDSGRIPQKPGTEPVHVSVVFLDQDFFARIGSQYGLADARYQIRPSQDPAEASVTLERRSGQVIGFLVWRPFAPGSQVTSLVGPVLAMVLLLSIVVIYMLAARLVGRTSDLEESRLQAQHQAMHDGLTGLANRAMFERRFDEALQRVAHRPDALLALLYIDLDRFKQINDTLGHPAGDVLIRQVARRLVAEVRAYDLVARLGGDEFAILISEPEDREAIDRICSRIVAHLEQPFSVAGSLAYIGASIGIAIAPQHGHDRTELTRKADIALYRAKAEGRSRYLVFDPGMDAAVRARESTDRELRQAMADCDAQLRIHYQPVFSTRTGAMTGVEALLRWQHPENGLVAPGGFISAAEESGLIEPLGQWVLRRAAEDAHAWPGLRVAVNVSPIQVRSRQFVDRVREVLEATGLEPARLEIELTETALLGASDDVTETLCALRRLGIACALDDFGTGYSSLSHIRDIAVDRIKIDRSFVHAVNTPSGAALVEAVVSLARTNGLQVTAEGVENQAQHAFLSRAGCHEVQGYLLARPMPAAEITAMLASPPSLPAVFDAAHPAAAI